MKPAASPENLEKRLRFGIKPSGFESWLPNWVCVTWALVSSSVKWGNNDNSQGYFRAEMRERMSKSCVYSSVYPEELLSPPTPPPTLQPRALDQTLLGLGDLLGLRDQQGRLAKSRTWSTIFSIAHKYILFRIILWKSRVCTHLSVFWSGWNLSKNLR